MAKKEKGYLRRQLADGLKKHRGGMSQNKFAKKLSVDGSTLNRLENCAQNVTIDTLEQICRDLRCELSDLLES
ncbi:MAG: helix-turn-helix domain-containing protein [Pseudomonadota bacterium]